MRVTPRSTRRVLAAQPLVDKANQINELESAIATSGKKARHRLSTAELARLEDVFRKETHPSRQQKKDLAAELGMDYKTITIWFQNKRQTSKRGLHRPSAEDPDRAQSSGRARADSCLRSVSSPSHNATLDASGIDPMAHPPLRSKDLGIQDELNAVTSRAIIKIKPLFDSLNALMSRPREHAESTEVTRDEGPDTKNIDPHRPRTLSENAIASAEQEQLKAKTVKWKRIRTLEWACERQAKRRKLSREGYVRLGSGEVQDGPGAPNETRMDSALSLLSLASSTQVGPSKDVVRGASLLLNFKHSWRRKQQV